MEDLDSLRESPLPVAQISAACSSRSATYREYKALSYKDTGFE
jgi:hypothetical protein